MITEITDTITNESGDNMKNYDFSEFANVELINADISSMTDEQLAVLYEQARYCQAMTDADIDTMRELVSEDMTYTHMSGMTRCAVIWKAHLTACVPTMWTSTICTEWAVYLWKRSQKLWAGSLMTGLSVAGGFRRSMLT